MKIGRKKFLQCIFTVTLKTKNIYIYIGAQPMRILERDLFFLNKYNQKNLLYKFSYKFHGTLRIAH